MNRNRASLIAAANQSLDLDKLLPSMTSFVGEYLKENSTIDPALPIYDHLLYCACGDVELIDCPWFTGAFPQSVPFSQIVEAIQLLRELPPPEER